jgi:hypothetical protein
MIQGEGKASKWTDGWGELIGGGLFLFGMWAAIAYLLPDGWPVKYAVRYFTPYNHVTVEARPTKCDFFRTPIGGKGCHYVKTITTAEWRRSTTGNAILSSDEGATWEVRDPPPNTKLPTKFLWVDWNRVEDP